MTFNEIDALIKKWKLADAKKEIPASNDLSKEQVLRLSEHIRLYEECGQNLKIASQSLPVEGFQQLKGYHDQSLLKSHPDYDAINKTLADGIVSQIDNYIAEARQNIKDLAFEDASSLLNDAEVLGRLLEDPNEINRVQQHIKQLDSQKQAEDLKTGIFRALEEGVPATGFELLLKLESLGVLPPSEIAKLRDELNSDELHRMGQSRKGKASTEYENIVNVRRSLEESTKYRLKYNAEIRYLDLAEVRKESLEKELNSILDDVNADVEKARIETELETINEEMSKSRRLSDEFYKKAIEDVREKVKNSIASARKHLDLGNYTEASASLEVARAAGKPDEKFAGFVEDRLLEISLENDELQQIAEIQSVVTIKQEKRDIAQKTLNDAKAVLSQSTEDLVAIQRIKHELDEISQEDPHLSGLSLAIRKVDEKIESIQLRKKALIEVEMRNLANQWDFGPAQEKLSELKPLCDKRTFDELESFLVAQKNNQHLAKLKKTEFEKTFQEKLNSVDANELNDLKALLDEWQQFAGFCESEIVTVIAYRKEVDRFSRKHPELSRSKNKIEQVLQDEVESNYESNAAAYSLASSMVREQPDIVSLLTRYWLKIADGILDKEAEQKLKTLQIAKEITESSHDDQLANLVNRKIKEFQDRTTDGKRANRILEQLTPLLEGDKPDIQEAGRILGGIPSNDPILQFPVIRDLVDKKERLAKNEIAQIKYAQVRDLIDNNDDLDQVIKTLTEILEIDPDNSEYQRAFAKAQFNKQNDELLEQKIDQYRTNVDDIAKLNEIKVFVEGLSGKKCSTTISIKIEDLKSKATDVTNALNERFEKFETSVNYLVEQNQFDDARKTLADVDITSFHPDHYIKYGNLKSAVENKINLAIIADRKIVEAQEKAKMANFMGALRDLTGINGWTELPEQKRLEVEEKQNKLNEYKTIYEEAEGNLDETSATMGNLRSSFVFQNDVKKKLLGWSNTPDIQVRETVQRTNNRLVELNVHLKLPKDNAILNSYERLATLLDALDAIEMNSPDTIPNDKTTRKEQLEALTYHVEKVDEVIKDFPANIKHLQPHRNTRKLIVKCEQNAAFRTSIYKIKKDLETANFLTNFSGIWKKHIQDLEEIKTLYHFSLEEVDNA